MPYWSLRAYVKWGNQKAYEFDCKHRWVLLSLIYFLVSHFGLHHTHYAFPGGGT